MSEMNICLFEKINKIDTSSSQLSQKRGRRPKPKKWKMAKDMLQCTLQKYNESPGITTNAEMQKNWKIKRK